MENGVCVCVCVFVCVCVNNCQSPLFYRWECNLAAVWGQMSTGGGHSQLEENMSVLGVPVMTKRSFIDTERAISEVWKLELLESSKTKSKI